MISMPDRPKYNRQAAGKAWFDPTIEEWPEGKPLPTRCSCLALAYEKWSAAIARDQSRRFQMCPRSSVLADDYRIFVGDLGNEVNDETLALAFKKYALPPTFRRSRLALGYSNAMTAPSPNTRYPSFHKAKIVREKWNHKSKVRTVQVVHAAN